MKTTKSEDLLLKAYLNLPKRKLLEHKYESEEDFLAGYVSRFINGERFEIEFTAFSSNESEILNSLITRNFENDDGKDLLTAFLLTKIVCNIMNKYKK